MRGENHPYFRVPIRITPDLLATIKRSGRSVFITALLHHIEWQEDELSKQNRAVSERRDLIGGKT